MMVFDGCNLRMGVTIVILQIFFFKNNLTICVCGVLMKFASSSSFVVKRACLSNVRKVIQKMRHKQSLADIQEERIAAVLTNEKQIHPKMRLQDVEELEKLKSMTSLFESSEDAAERDINDDYDNFDDIAHSAGSSDDANESDVANDDEDFGGYDRISEYFTDDSSENIHL